ncbi:hypothetical protein ST47_g10382 [Ascochyta rabiei]|uniref:Metal ion transmembrane transporter n=1 Tax=Didymella rabiei TaxID=5454 RepID=A0A162VHP3_DIDRA|nr:hypothetical protein ST47_g10382 [Ascochyta rabiei]
MATLLRPASPAEDLPQYYQDLGDTDITNCFRNFDLEKNFDRFDRQTRSPKTTNFCLDFGEDEAFCAFDLAAFSYSRLLEAPRPPHLHTRWINIWQPYNQKDTLRLIGQHYDFSPRLLSMMCSDPVPARSGSSNMDRSVSTLRSRLSHRSKHSKSSSEKSKSGSNKNTIDSEESIGMTELMHSTQLEMVRDLTHYQIVEDVWHWSTVDWGRRWYNTLHNVHNKQTHHSHHHAGRLNRDQDIPYGKRVWNWLLLCEDKTVISISEDPFPFANGEVHGWDLRMLYTIRRNLVNVFRQLTKAPTPLADAALTQLPIRHRIGHSEEETAHRATDTPGLLFYYLFEDWGTTFGLISRSEEGYSAELDRLRKEMLIKADLTHVDQLHHIGCQLAVLRRVYHSYELLIERILEKREATLASLKNSHVMSHAESMLSSMHSTESPNPLLPELASSLGVALSSAARVRFERLKDRIILYALSEIQECIDQKDSLVMMNFNLIAIKESFSVERLTWVTLVLAQITILFTPVTLMTGYFSIQFKDTEFEIKSYWWAFAIVLSLSLLMLFMFSFLSGTLNGHILSRSWSRMMLDLSKRWWAHRKKRDKTL